MTDLAIASAILVDILGYYSRETVIHMRENSKGTRVRDIAVLPDSMVPTVINGLVGAISMVVGFTGVIGVFTVTRMWEKMKLGSSLHRCHVN